MPKKYTKEQLKANEEQMKRELYGLVKLKGCKIKRSPETGKYTLYATLRNLNASQTRIFLTHLARYPSARR